jgi:hypothetical protein
MNINDVQVEMVMAVARVGGLLGDGSMMLWYSLSLDSVSCLLFSAVMIDSSNFCLSKLFLR